ncbi:hypothetical protein MP11Mi_12730 [Gordonia sp. MP11Mi]|uniref:Uncharacterized protein n=2 Tax=Gordonia sp. MP11Mi TaxID=3022769 RepID=A0AA97GU01_9ACTN
MDRDGHKWTMIPREGGRYRLEVRDKNGRLIQFGEFAPDGSGKGRMIGEDGKWHDAYFRPDGSIFLPGEWAQGSGDFLSHFDLKTDVTILPDGTRVEETIMRDPDWDDRIVGHRKVEVTPDGSFRRYWSADIDGELQERPINQIDSGAFTDALWWFMPIPGAGLAMKGASKLAGKIPGLNKAIPKIAEKLHIPKPRQAPLGTAPGPMPKRVPGADPDPLPPPGGIPGLHPTPKSSAPNPHLDSTWPGTGKLQPKPGAPEFDPLPTVKWPNTPDTPYPPRNGEGRLYPPQIIDPRTGAPIPHPPAPDLRAGPSTVPTNWRNPFINEWIRRGYPVPGPRKAV